MHLLLLMLLAPPPARAADDVDYDGWTEADGDCDDTDPNTYPGAPELLDGVDND